MELELKEQLLGHKKIPFPLLMKHCWKYIKKELGALIGSAILIIINVFLSSIIPIFAQRVVENLQSTNIILTMVISYAVGILVLTIVNEVILYFESMILQKAGQRIVLRLRVDVFEHVENMSLNQLNAMPVGSLVTRVANYTESMSDLFTNTLVNVIGNVLTIVVVYGIMFFISPKLSLIMLIFVAVLFGISYVFSKIVSKQFRKERDAISDLNTFVNENVSGMKIIQLFNKEKRKLEDFRVKNEKYRKIRYGVVLCFAAYRPLIALIHMLAVAVSFWSGISLLLTGGEIIAFYLLLSRFFNPVQNLADQLNNIQRAMSACEKLFNLMDIEPEVVDAEDAIEVEHFKGKIEFKNVWFAYENEDWILKDVSFVVEPGQTVAFVGPTGVGKTTILSLIVRNFEINKGQILIDDIDIKKIKIKSLRKAIGQMLQDVFLFSGTIKDNITLFDDSYSDDDVIDVCNYVNAFSFIEKSEKGIYEEVIERGENYSTGQRQLISFARTVLAMPQILILDEATANIDTETEHLIQEALYKMKSIGTMLIVAHRLSTIQHSDQIFVLNNGRIAESGKHQELLKKKGIYYKLYELQFKNKQ